MSTETLRLAIDASPAVAGGKKFEKAAKDVAKTAAVADKSISRLGRTMNEVRSKAGVASGALNRVGKSMKGVNRVGGVLSGQMVTMAAAFAGLAAIKKVITLLAEFEQAMLTIGAVTEATAEQMAEMTAVARQLGATTRFTAAQASDAMLTLARAGFSANESIAALKPTLDLAVAGAVSLTTAADTTASAIRQFGLEANEAGRVSDVLLAATNKSNQNVTELGEAMKFAGPAASAAGLSIEQTSAAIGILSNAGVKASLAGTNLRGILLGLTTASGRSAGAMARMGLTMKDLDPTQQSLVSLFKKMNKGILTLDRAGAIFGRRNAAAALILAQNVDVLGELTGALDEAEGTSAKMSATMDSGLIGSMKALVSASEELALQMGDGGLNTVLKDVLDVTVGVLRSFGGVATGMEKLRPEIIQAQAVIRGLATALGVLISIKVAAWIARTGVAALASPYGLLAIGVGLLITNLNSLETPLQRSIEQIDRLLKSVRDLQPGDAGIAQITGEIDKISQRLRDLRGEQKDLSGTIRKEAQNFFGTLRNEFRPVGGGLQGQAPLARFADIQKEIAKFESLQIELQNRRETLLDEFQSLQTADLADVPFASISAVSDDFQARLEKGADSPIAKRVNSEVNALADAFQAVTGQPISELNAEIARLEAGLEGVFESSVRAKIEALIATGKDRLDLLKGLRTNLLEAGREEAERVLTARAVNAVEKQTVDVLARKISQIGLSNAEVQKANAIDAARNQLVAVGVTNMQTQNELLGRLAVKYDELAAAQSRQAEVDQIQEATLALEDQGRALGLSGAALEKHNLQTQLRNSLMEGGIKLTADGEAAIQKLGEEFDKLQVMKEITQIFQEFGNAVADAFSEFVTGSKSAEDALEDLFKTIAKSAIQKGIGSLFGSLTGAIGGAIGSAKGNVFQGGFAGGGSVVPFATGGIIRDQISFPLAGGKTGIAGEGGKDEAIIPLSRGPGGRLGVDNSGSGGGGVTVQQTIIFQGVQGGDGTFRKSARQIGQTVRQAAQNGADQ